MRLLICLLFTLTSVTAQDLTGRWVAVTGTTSGYYAELFLVKNIGNTYAGHSYDTENGGYCRHWMNGEFNPERQFLSGLDVELINKSPEHEATDYQLRYEKGENGREYLIGTATITPLNRRQYTENLTPFQKLEYQMLLQVTPPNFVKFVKVSDDYRMYEDSMPLAMSPQEVMLEKAAFPEVYEEDLLLDERQHTPVQDRSTADPLPRQYESDVQEEETAAAEDLNVNTEESEENTTTNQLTEVEQTAVANKTLTELPEPDITEIRAARSDQLLSHVKLKTNKVTLLIRDYGTVDNDSVTIFYNNKIIAENMRITAEAKEFELILEPGRRNELVFVANNLGDVPPNTARITLIADDRRYNYKLFTDEKNNALVLLENLTQ